jgi:hypothetical protein
MKSSYIRRTGHDRTRIVKASQDPAAQARRKRARTRLSENLDAETKSLNELLVLKFDNEEAKKQNDERIAWKEKNIKRIISEITSLNSKLGVA